MRILGYPTWREALRLTNSCRSGRVRALALRFAPGHAFGTSGNFERYVQALGRRGMKIQWEYEETDVLRVRDLIAQTGDSYLVRQRISRNVTGKVRADLSKELTWYALVSCLLTTQQRSGPTSKVNRLVCTKPFPLRLEVCENAEDLGQYMTGVAREWGLRRGPTIARELEKNLRWLRAEGGWEILMSLLKTLESHPGLKEERRAARELAERLHGVGPKQSRNFLQMLGLTKHEIPLDSRVVKWLNDGGFPIPLTSQGLSDEGYYSFVMDRVQGLCEEAEVLPCVLDALIFASADKDEWTEDNHVW